MNVEGRTPRSGRHRRRSPADGRRAGPFAHNDPSAPAAPSTLIQGNHDWSFNGCSTQGAAINAKPGVFDFTHACVHLDGRYAGLDRSGFPAVISRRTCDSWFLTDVRASCTEVHGSSTSRNARERRSTASTYYYAVRLFGGRFYTASGSRL